MDEIPSMGLAYALWRRSASRALAPFAITFSQLQLIQLARRRGSISLSFAARELSWDRPTTSLVARKCVAGLWLSRNRSSADRRSARLSLTGEGEELLDRIEASRALAPESLGDPLDVLASEERAEFRRALDKISRRARDIL